MTGNKKGVIYDLDGTIIVTTGLHEQGLIKAGKHLNIDITPDFLINQKGLTDEAAARQLLGDKFDEQGKRFIRIKQDHVIQNTASVSLYKDFLEAYKKLTKVGINVWICTSASKEFIFAVYNNLPKLQALAVKTVFREMYTHGKPNPEPILLTSKMMGLPIQDCIYVGDAYNDYLASINAGCEFVYSCRNPEDKDIRIPASVPIISNHTQILSLIGK